MHCYSGACKCADGRTQPYLWLLIMLQMLLLRLRLRLLLRCRSRKIRVRKQVWGMCPSCVRQATVRGACTISLPAATNETLADLISVARRLRAIAVSLLLGRAPRPRRLRGHDAMQRFSPADASLRRGRRGRQDR